LGQLVSTFGDTLHYIALVVLVFQLTGQGVAVAALVAANCWQPRIVTIQVP
jgi:hypothetical protein